jgi:hypothetical protein
MNASHRKDNLAKANRLSILIKKEYLDNMNINRKGIYLEQALFPIDTINFQALISTKALPHLINDFRFRIMLIDQIIWGLQTSADDVKTAFMYFELQEEIFVNLPGGMDDDANHYSLFVTKYDNLRFTAKRKRMVQTFIVVLKWIGFT